MEGKEVGGIGQSPPESGAQPEKKSVPLPRSVTQDGGEINADEPADALPPVDAYARDPLPADHWERVQAEMEAKRAEINGGAELSPEEAAAHQTEIGRRSEALARQNETEEAGDEELDPLAVERLADAEIEPYDWLIKGWLARKAMTLFSSEPKLGKSTLAAKLAADVSRMDDGGMVLMCYLESAAAIEHWPRMLAAEADAERVMRPVNPVIENGKAFALNIRKLLDHHELTPDLIVVDPLASVAGDTNSSKEARAVMLAFQGLAEDYNCAVLVVHHNSKQTKGRMAVGSVMDLSSGSQQIVGAARIIWQMHPNPDDDEESDQKLPPVAVRLRVNTDEPLDGGAFEVASEQIEVENKAGKKVWARRVTDLIPRGGDVMADIESTYRGQATSTEKSDAVLDALEEQIGEWMTATEITKATGLARRTVTYRMTVLVEQKAVEVRKREGQGGGHEYRVTAPRF